MNLLSRFFGRPGADRTHNGPALPEHVERALEAQSRRVHRVDPETSRQWRLLRSELGREERTLPARRFVVRLARPAAAIAALGTMVILAALLWPSGPSTLAYETGRGQQTAVLLSDSSEVTLNHTSELLVEQRGQSTERKVTLKGEAFFRVRKSDAPFVVRTDIGTIRVLGTEFNVRVRSDRLEVAVVRGSVRVSSDAASESVTLQKGQLTSCRRGGVPEQPGEISFREYPGWLHGKLLFDRASLRDACREIADRFDVSVSVDLAQPEATITGALDAPTAEAAVATLARLTGNRYRHDESGYTLY